MQSYVILWVDNRHSPHTRVVTGSRDEAQQAFGALQNKYEHGEGFHSAGITLLDLSSTLSSVLAETKEAAR